MADETPTPYISCGYYGENDRWSHDLDSNTPIRITTRTASWGITVDELGNLSVGVNALPTGGVKRIIIKPNTPNVVTLESRGLFT